MRMSVTTHNVLDRLHNWPGFRPYNFFLRPILADCGYPGRVGDPKKFSLVAPFESDQSKWPDSECTNIGDPLNPDPKKYTLITEFVSRLYGARTVAIADTFKNLLYRYMMHPEAKSLGPDGKPCKRDTRGLLQRVHVIAGKHRRIGKECDRRWEEGDDFESTMLHEPIEYTRNGEGADRDGMEKARERFIRQIKKIGFQSLIQLGCTRHHLRTICCRKLVRVSVLHEYERKVRLCVHAWRTGGA
jgi:hypothetical protein